MLIGLLPAVVIATVVVVTVVVVTESAGQQVAAVAFGLGRDVESAGQQVAADPQVVVGQTGVDPAADQLAAAVQLVAVDLVADHQQR